MRKKPVISKVLAILILLFSLLILYEMRHSFDMEILQLVLEPSQISKSYRVDLDELNELRWSIISSYIKNSLFALSLFAAIVSSLIVIIRESRPWHIVLGSASFASFIMFLIIFWKVMPDLEAFRIDIIGSTYFYLFTLINLFGAIYFLPRSKRILTTRST